MEEEKKKGRLNGIIQAMGLVFGDIGTSPIYTFTVIFLTLPITLNNILSILSLVVWTLILIVTIQYVFLAMSLSKRGEGGAFVLNQILQKLVKSSRMVMFTSLLTYIGISLLIGDSVITPAMSILSAVEGLKILPSLSHLSQGVIVAITLTIAIVLFSIQKNGTEKISKAFGPVMALWFVALGGFGLFSLWHCPVVLKALDPFIGVNFLLHHGFAGFFVLSEVILCATGAEALYVDMGQLGRQPITDAWKVVGPALIINYLGQGAFLYTHPGVKNTLFLMVASCNHYFYIPFLLLSVMATIIASQAMISGLFSIVYQGINTHIFPLFKINYTSKFINSQIYIGGANAFLFFFVTLIILIFQSSAHLAAAYGLAVTGTMNITVIMISMIFFFRKKYGKMLLALCLWMIDVCFLSASLFKIPMGAYWSLIIAFFPFALILIYTKGHKKLYRKLHFMDHEVFMKKYNEMYNSMSKITGTAIFFVRGIEKIPPYVTKVMFTNDIMYTDNVFVLINKMQEADGIDYCVENVTAGLRLLKINIGYMEVLNLKKILKDAGIDEKVIFYGEEDIATNSIIWKVFAAIKKLSPNFVSFYDMPAEKVHGVVTKIELA
ncbi:MAG: KUP/HAK/KT family potassium transporter [Clostridiaceae bacterium]|nr:KUP/HAK/KT family potassium transporter [Clostridiaceae bacterium]